MQGGEKEPRDDDDVSKLWENAEAVFCGQGTDSVAYVLSKLGNHDGQRAREGQQTRPGALHITSCHTTQG